MNDKPTRKTKPTLRYDIHIGPAPQQTDPACSLLNVEWRITGPHFDLRGLSLNEADARETVNKHVAQLRERSGARIETLAAAQSRARGTQASHRRHVRDQVMAANRAWHGEAPDWVLAIAQRLNDGITYSGMATLLGISNTTVSAVILNNYRARRLCTEKYIGGLAQRVRERLIDQEAA